MKHRLIYLLSLLFVLSCEDTTPIRDNPFDPENPNYIYSSLSGLISDHRISSPVQGCIIILDETDTTINNDEGFYSFENVVHGEHILTIENINYFSIKDTITVEYNTHINHNVSIVEDAPYLELSDSILIFLPAETNKDLILSNSGTQNLDWSINYEEESINVNVMSGSLSPDEYQNLNFVVNKNLLEIGSYDISIDFISNGGNYTLPLKVFVEPILIITTDSIHFDMNTLNSFFGLVNPGGGTLDFTINENITWLTLSLYEGQIQGDTLIVEAFVDTNYVNDGNNAGVINVNSSNGVAIISTSIYSPYPPALEISVYTLDFGLDLETMSFFIINGGDGILFWNIGQIEDWLEVTPQSGQTINEELVYITVDRSLLFEGDYNFNLEINANSQNEEIDLSLNVLPILYVSESYFDFNSSINEFSFQITNVGNGIMPWAIDVDDNWLQLSEQNGQTTFEQDIINVFADRSGLESGSYNSSINVSSGENYHVIDIEMYVPQPPVLEVSDMELDFSNDQNMMNCFISNGGEGELEWSISENISWLSITPSSGTTTTEQDQITVTISNESLSNGQYSDTFSITSNGGSEVINVLMLVVNPFYEDFEDLSDWYGDVGTGASEGWYNSGDTYSIPTECLEGDCARYYLWAGGDGEPQVMSREVFVAPGMILQMYAYGAYGTDIKIYLDDILIHTVDAWSSVNYINQTITTSGNVELRISGGGPSLAVGYVDELSIE